MSITGIFRWEKGDFTTAQGYTRVRWQGSKGKNRGRRQKERRLEDHRAFIDSNPPTDGSDGYGNSSNKCAA